MTLRNESTPSVNNSPVATDVAAELLDLDQATEKLRLGRTKLFALIAADEIRSVKLGRKRYIRVSEVSRYILAAERAGLAPRRRHRGGVR